MARLSTVERRKDRIELVRDAGHGRISGPAVAGGVASAFGAFAVVLGVAVAIAEVVGVDARGFTHGDWRAVGLACGIATAIVACATWAFGGYVAGRMARRAGARHGLMVFVASVAVLAIAAAVVWGEHGVGTIRDALRRQGAPTARGDWWDIAALTGLLTFVGALVGSFLGGVRGERWHQHLVERALDPAYGPEADARAAAEARAADARGRVERAAPTATYAGETEPEPETDEEWIRPARAGAPATSVDLRDGETDAARTASDAGDEREATGTSSGGIVEGDRRLTTHPGGAWRRD